MAILRTTLALALLLVAGCGSAPRLVGRVPAHGADADVVEIGLSLSNAFLIESVPPILVDCGTPGDEDALSSALAKEGYAPGDIALVVVTHGHADHAGLARWLQAKGAKIVLGAGDAPLARAGHNDEMRPTNLTARLIHPFVDRPYEPFAADVTVTAAPLSLAPWGLRGQVESLPGHTAGSLIVTFAERQVFAGDMILGGVFGSAIGAQSAGEHYYQADFETNHRNVRALLKRGFTTFYLGHGGPVEAESVRGAFGE